VTPDEQRQKWQELQLRIDTLRATRDEMQEAASRAQVRLNEAVLEQNALEGRMYREGTL
jgi:hypothetical protein